MRVPSLATACCLAALVALPGCGRSPSRYLGASARQVLGVENLQEFISLSFDRRGESTVKDVTYRAGDGYVYTQEFKDFSLLEGAIRWVPHGESDSLIQKRAISRWIGKPVNLRLPEDCAEVLGVDVGYSARDERVKNLVYRATDGRVLAKEYREGLVARHFGGWLEVRKR
jgi:hypothetical protein